MAKKADKKTEEVKEVVEVVEETVTEEVKEEVVAETVKVKAIENFYDQENDCVRRLGDEWVATKERSEKLSELKYVLVLL